MFSVDLIFAVFESKNYNLVEVLELDLLTGRPIPGVMT
jgi:hypothetical protein